MKVHWFKKMFVLGLLIAGSEAALAGSVCVSYWPWGTCAAWEATSELSSDNGSSGRDHDQIYFKNNCSRKIYTAIHVVDLSGSWGTHGWWALNPGETAHVANTQNSIFFVHAHTSDHPANQLKWGGDDYHSRIRNTGEVEGFKRVQSDPDDYVDFTYSFHCDGINRHKAIALAWNQNGQWATRARNTLEEAKRAALDACPGCSLWRAVVDPRGPGCMAVVRASGTPRLYASVKLNANDARNSALQSCRQNHASCQSEITSCND